MCRGAMRRRAASMHASSPPCAASAAMRPASAASTASAAAATRPSCQAKTTYRNKMKMEIGLHLLPEISVHLWLCENNKHVVDENFVRSNICVLNKIIVIMV